MDKIKVLRGYYPILGISSVLVLLIVGLLSVFSLQDKISFQEGQIKEHIQKTIFSLQSTIAPTIEQGNAIRNSAEYYLNNPNIQSENLYFKYLNNSNIAEFNAYDMDSLPSEYRKYIGNITGLDLLESISAEEIEQINMATYVSPLLSSLKNNQESIVLSYYLSPQVCLVYPYSKSADFRLSSEIASHIPETNGVVYPEKNPERKHAWTEIYTDDVGNGLMVSGLFPVYKKDNFLGTLGFDFTLNNLNQIISNSQLSFGEDFIANNKSQLLAHPKLISAKDTSIKTITNLGIKKEDIDNIVNFQNLEKEKFHYLDKYIIYYQEIPLTPWYSIYYVEKSIFYWEIIISSAADFIVIFACLILVLLLTGWFTNRKFITPASLLVKHIQQENDNIATNEYLQSVPKEWKNWFAIVSNAFSQNREMVKALKESNESLEKKVAERTAEVSTQNEELLQQQEEILSQRDAIERKNKDLLKVNELINNSIDAAQIIQKAILPSEKRLKEILGETFVLNKPRDVVSGDFYWVSTVENKTVIILADCTGHGVPGAFMTLISITMLNRIVTLNKTLSPKEILNSLHDGIQNLLKQEETNTNVGMDAAVVVLENKNLETDICFAGAKIPLIYFDKKTDLIQEIKPARKSIGGYQNAQKEFINHALTLRKGSIIYLGSDGFADQNDINRRSLGRQAIITHFDDIKNLPIKEQRNSMQKLLDKQMEGTVQRDDILWLGILL